MFTAQSVPHYCASDLPQGINGAVMTAVAFITAGSNGHLTAVSNNYWSSTTYANNTNNAWIVNFNNGNTGTTNKNNNNYVRCVRSGA